MGASVRGETGTFHNTVSKLQLKTHRGSVGLPPRPSLAHAGRVIPLRKSRRPRCGEEIPAGERAQEQAEQAVRRSRRAGFVSDARLDSRLDNLGLEMRARFAEQEARFDGKFARADRIYAIVPLA